MKKLLFLLLLSTSFAFSQQTKFQKIDSLLTFLNTNNKFMGELSIIEKGKIVFSKAYGFADVESGKKLDVNTKLKIGSITKTFTATMIMQLVDEKKLTLDTKLSKFYPKIPNADKITIHHLLHHRTGIPDFLNDDPTVGEFIYAENKKEDLVKRIENYTSAFEPNSQHKYSNSNYNLLGYIIEDITKKSFAENLNTRIVKKIGLKNTSFPTKIDITKNEGYSFAYDGKTWEKIPEWSSNLAFSAGAMSSTTNDLNIFLETLLEGKLTSKSSLEQMKSMEDYYGKGLIIAPFEERKFYGHTGGIENFRAAAGYNPDDKTGFAIIVNGDNYSRNDIMIGVLSLFYGKEYTFPDLKGFKVSKESLSKYVGIYSTPTFPMKITITEVNGELLAQATGQGSFPLTAKSETEFIFTPAGIKMTFAENEMTLNQGGMKTVFKKE
ncbi:MAG TPA: serine hydrolase domain-containing protein [Flavobacterium sp.]|jgi:CubicO group peptidase (beta-lactamase class C family)|nr:serine hydrolase domain-containing protein [Flavobacterium sp.]HQW69929.1 serine hydrolase domain-containing protein [Flavobacterium sp.]